MIISKRFLCAQCSASICRVLDSVTLCLSLSPSWFPAPYVPVPVSTILFVIKHHQHDGSKYRTLIKTHFFAEHRAMPKLID
jgi:hypothetical protein